MAGTLYDQGRIAPVKRQGTSPLLIGTDALVTYFFAKRIIFYKYGGAS